MTSEFETSHRIVDSASPREWATALDAVEPRMTPAHRTMLVAHAQAASRELSMAALGSAVGYSPGVVNMQYGRLARMFAEHFGATGLTQHMHAIATGVEEPDAHGHWQWKLREPLAHALALRGWVTSTETNDSAPSTSYSTDEGANGDSTSTSRDALVQARIGQGPYRAALFRLWGGRCALTGAAVEAALIASHILAWEDATDAERLDPFNGLLLAAQVDRLFDRGLISFADDGRLLRGAALADAHLRSLGIDPAGRLRRVSPPHRRYLAVHRKKHGFSTE